MSKIEEMFKDILESSPDRKLYQLLDDEGIPKGIYSVPPLQYIDGHESLTNFFKGVFLNHGDEADEILEEDFGIKRVFLEEIYISNTT